jgi:hypothetical protein
MRPHFKVSHGTRCYLSVNHELTLPINCTGPPVNLRWRMSHFAQWTDGSPRAIAVPLDVFQYLWTMKSEMTLQLQCLQLQSVGLLWAMPCNCCKCSNPVPDYYNVTLDVAPHRTTKAWIETCTSQSRQSGLCPHGTPVGSRFIQRSVNSPCEQSVRPTLAIEYQSSNNHLLVVIGDSNLQPINKSWYKSHK